LIDFGFSKVLKNLAKDRVKTNCGTPAYAAPEVMMGSGYTYKADIWSLGILICELVGGFTPFSGKALEHNDHFQSSENGGCRDGSPSKNGSVDPRMMIEMANAGRLSLPKNLNNVTRDLIKQILVADPNQRYGI